MITNRVCLDLNKRRIRKDVISKLRKFGYVINDNASAQEVRTVVKEFQLKNGLIVDGYIGYRTKALLNRNMVKYKDMYDGIVCNKDIEKINGDIEKIKVGNIPLNCVNCGAPLQSHHCEYCDTDYGNYKPI